MSCKKSGYRAYWAHFGCYPTLEKIFVYFEANALSSKCDHYNISITEKRFLY